MKSSTKVNFDNMPQAVAEVQKEVSSIKEQLIEIKEHFEPRQPTEYLTRKEVATLLKCDQSTVFNWVKRGKLQRHCIGNRTYYKRSEVESAIKPI